MFDRIPNKRQKPSQITEADVWPKLSDRLEVNRFYRQYVSAEGWVGEGYLMIWPREDVFAFRTANFGTYPEKYNFFGSNGGGTQFGYFEDSGKVTYVAAPDIGIMSDIKVLGSWRDFIECLAANDYI